MKTPKPNSLNKTKYFAEKCPKESLMRSLAIATFCLLTSTVALAKGDGGGVNGPNLQGSSIPVQLDGKVTSADVGAAERTCYIDGDKRRHLRSFMDQLAEAWFPEGIPDDLTLAKKDVFLTLEIGSPIKNGNYWQVEANATSLRQSKMMTVFVEESFQRIRFDNFGRSAKIIDLVAAQGGTFLPYFRSEPMDSAKCIKYGTYGECLEYGEPAVKGLALAYPANPLSVALPLINDATKHSTPVTVNTQAVADCLISEIQRRASKE